jgi:hypothetical protein
MVALINVKKVSAAVITSMMIALRDLLPMFGLEMRMATSDAAGCNWVSFCDTLLMCTFRDALPWQILDKYTDIDYNVRCLMKDPVTRQWCIFLPDIPHLTKNILTCLELLFSSKSKQKLKLGRVPMNMGMVEDVWLKSDSASGQLHITKLTSLHFEMNAYSWMNVQLTTQFLSASTTEMIQSAMDDDEIMLNLREKGMYRHIWDLCMHWNGVFDICNRQDRPHCPENAVEQQTHLLQTLDWFSKWKALHNEMMREKRATEFIFFADKTLFCIKALLLGHVSAIDIFCAKNEERINPRTMNTDTVEWHFGNARQMVGRSTNKLTAAGFGNADKKKASTFNAANMAIVGNNSSGVCVCVLDHR